MVAVDFHVLRFRPQNLVQPSARDRVAAGKCTINIGRSHVSDRHDFHIVGGMLVDQHVAFVAGADEGCLDRITFELAIAEVQRSKACTCSGSRLHKVSTRNPDNLVEVVFADLFLLRSKKHDCVPLPLG